MASLSPEIIKQFAQYGGYIGLLTAVLILVCFAAIWFLWKHLAIRDKKFESLHSEFRETLVKVQEKRVVEAKSVSDQLAKLTEETNKAIHGLTDALERQRETTLLVVSKLGER